MSLSFTSPANAFQAGGFRSGVSRTDVDLVGSMELLVAPSKVDKFSICSLAVNINHP